MWEESGHAFLTFSPQNISLQTDYLHLRHTLFWLGFTAKGIIYYRVCLVGNLFGFAVVCACLWSLLSKRKRKRQTDEQESVSLTREEMKVEEATMVIRNKE